MKASNVALISVASAASYHLTSVFVWVDTTLSASTVAKLTNKEIMCFKHWKYTRNHYLMSTATQIPRGTETHIPCKLIHTKVHRWEHAQVIKTCNYVNMWTMNTWKL